MLLPPGQHIGVDLLIDDPLLAGVIEAEIAGLRPGCQMVDLVVSLVIKPDQRPRPGQIAVLGIQTK